MEVKKVQCWKSHTKGKYYSRVRNQTPPACVNALTCLKHTLLSSAPAVPGAVRLHCGCTEKQHIEIIKMARSQKTARILTARERRREPALTFLFSFHCELFTEISASELNCCHDSWARGVSNWGTMEHIAVVLQGSGGSLCSRGCVVLSGERFQAGCAPGENTATHIQV